MNKRFKENKPANIMLKPEEVVIGSEYAFTLNPVAQPGIGKVNSFMDWYQMFEHVFRDCCVASEYRIYIEISPMGRFHFHGKIKITNIMNFYIYDVKTLTNASTCVIKVMENPDEWEDYYLKQQQFMQDYLIKELCTPFTRPKAELIMINTFKDYPESLSCKRYPGSLSCPDRGSTKTLNTAVTVLESNLCKKRGF